MSFPLYPNNPSMGMNAPVDPFQSGMFASVPGAFPPPTPIAMQVPGLFPPADPFAPAMPFDPFGMPPIADPMSGFPMDPTFGGNPFGTPPMIDPFTGMTMDPFGTPSMVDPFTGMSMAPFGTSPMMDPMMSGMPMDPYGMPTMIDPLTGMPIDPLMSSMSLPQDIDPVTGMPLSMLPPEPDSPLKQMLKNLLKMQLFKKLFNPTDPGADTEQIAVSDNVTALDLISDADNFEELSAGDGSVSYLDLSRAARKSSNAEVRAAASYILNTNPHLFDQLESIKNAGDGIFTEKDLGKALRNKSIIQGKPGESTNSEKITDNISALDQLASKFNKLEKAGIGPKGKTNGKLTFVELSRAANNSEDPAIKELAEYLMKSGLFAQLDDLDGDDGVSLSTINQAYQDPGIVSGKGPTEVVIDTAGMTEQQALQVLNNNLTKFDRAEDPRNKKRKGKSNSRINAEDLDAVINSRDKSITMEMKKAAKVLQDNGSIAKMDSSESSSNTDGAVSFDTVRSWATDYETAGRKANGPKDLQKAMSIINSNINVFTNGDGNKKLITYNELIGILNSTDEKYTPEIKSAVQYLKDNKDKFDKLEAMDLTDDDKIQIDVISDAAAQGESLDYGFGTDASQATAEKNKQALEFLRSKWNDGIKEQDLKNILSDSSGAYTAKEKNLINYILNNPQGNGTSLWEALDGRDNHARGGDFDYDPNEVQPGNVKNDSIGSKS
jgi:hypothetical protein